MTTKMREVLLICLLTLAGCNKDEEPKKITCGCESDTEAIITDMPGKIQFNVDDQPVTYILYGYYGTGLMVCADSTFKKLLAQSTVMDGDSIVFGGDAKNMCKDCEFCALISVSSLLKK
jgi:hypothetical protein